MAPIARLGTTPVFDHMSGRQLAAWGYGIFWFGLLIETVNAFVSAQSTDPLSTPVFWIGGALALACLGVSIRMMLLIRHRFW